MLRYSLVLLYVLVPVRVWAQWQLPPGTSSSAEGVAAQSAAAPTGAATIAAAEKRMEAQDWAGAVTLLRPLVAQKPTDAHAQYDLGFALDNSGDAAGARTAYEAAAKADSSLVSARVSLGLLLARKGDSTGAEKWLRAALALPEDAPSRPARAQAERALARLDLHLAPEQARDELLTAIRLSSEQPEDVELSAEIAEALQDDAGAEQAYARILANNPVDPDAAAAYARALARQNKTTQADQVLEKALAAHPNSPVLLAARADLMLHAKKFDEAIPLLERLRSANPSDTSTTLLLARAYVAAGEPEKSNDLFTSLLSDDSKDASLLTAYADSLIRQKRNSEAEAVLQRALTLNFPTQEVRANAAAKLAFAASANHQPEAVLRAIQIRDSILPPDAATTFLTATAHDTLHHTAQAEENYRKFIQLAGSSFPDEVWQAKQRLQVLRRAK